MLIMSNYTFRLKPNDDLFNSIETFVGDKKIGAGCILSGVGSLTHVTLRFANREYHSEFDGHFEIFPLQELSPPTVHTFILPCRMATAKRWEGILSRVAGSIRPLKSC